MTEAQDFEINLEDHLNRVSRSFAVAITYLENPLRTWVSISYLLCRVLDTVEDAPWEKVTHENPELLSEQMYQDFRNFLIDPDALSNFHAWRNKFPRELPEGEILLLDDAKLLLESFHRLPALIQTVVRKPVLSMLRGMAHYTKEKARGNLVLKSMTEVNQYCLFVAGVVGELLENLFSASDDVSKKRSHQNLLQAYQFGMFLQKVNILKDQWGDETEGRFLVPHRQQLLHSLRTHARGAVDYLKSIAQPDHGYRMFCAFSLFLGVATLPMLSQAEGSTDMNKISREDAKQLMGQLESVINSNEEIENLYLGYMDQIVNPEIQTEPTSIKEIPVPSLHSLYEGSVSLDEWKSLVNKSKDA